MSQQKSKNEFAPSGFFALRTPLLPFDEILALSDDLEAVSAADDPARIEAAVTQDRCCLRRRLRAIFARPEVREALFVASPSLDQRLDEWLLQGTGPICRGGPEGASHKLDSSGFPQQADDRDGKLERALLRYFVRMAGRATPFGLFAGCSVGTFGVETQLALADRACYRRHTRLDMDYLVLLTDALAREPEEQSALRFGVNNSLYPVQGRLRYLEVRRNGQGWTHHQVAMEATGYLEATLARATPCATPPALAAGLLEEDPDATGEEAREYIRELIDSQVLVSELRPTVTGPEPLDGLVQRLGQLGSRAGDPLEQAGREMQALDAGGLGNDPARYRRVVQLLEALPGQLDPARLFQVDMIKPVEQATLGPAVVAEILRGVQILHRLARRPRNDRLASFREAFASRYEGREVPLVEALDAEAGVGFGTLTAGATDASSLLDDLAFPKAEDEQISWGQREKLLLAMLSKALARSANEIVLQPRDLDQLAEDHPPPLPDSLAVMASVAADSEADLACGKFQVLLDGVAGPSGARLLGRFCHADPQLRQWVEQHLRAEEALDPDALFAEVVHLPEGRMGNVLARPVLRAHEIPYLGRGSVPAPQQIPITDLLVSVHDEQIILRSARLGQRVIPRLTSAHNFENNQGIYAFLGAIQSQATAGGLAWDWGPLRGAPHLPRVVCGRLVLARAMWLVGQHEWRPLCAARGAARFRMVPAWRHARGLPRWVALVDADNELPIDLDNVLAADTLVELGKGRRQFNLVELFPGPDQLCVHGPEGRFVHELVVPLVRRMETRRHGDEERRRRPDAETRRTLEEPLRGSETAVLKHQDVTTACLRVSMSPRPGVFLFSHADQQRSFPPGSEWLFVKLYSGPATADQVLRDVVRPVVERAFSAGVADRWFFIRYSDPDCHLRLRLHGASAGLVGKVLPALQAAAEPLLADRRLWRIQLDTYEREVERYGGAEGIVPAEQLFQADSEAVLALAELFAEDPRGDLRWRLALAGMDLLLDDLDFDLEARCAVVQKMRDGFAAEFHADTDLARQLAARFRSERKALETLLNPAAVAEAPLAAGLEILRQRSQSVAAVMTELKARAVAGRLFKPLAELAASYLHMHANRLLRSAHRAQELVLYDFLYRLYQSQTARRREGEVRRDSAPAVLLPGLERTFILKSGEAEP